MPEAIAAAREGAWTIVLTPTKPVPHEWLPNLPGKDVLCLASGGGQQGPILAAAGARVTVFDLSPKQLASDRLVAEREGERLKRAKKQPVNLQFSRMIGLISLTEGECLGRHPQNSRE